MKVLVVNWRDPKNPEAGGAEIHIDEILKRKPRDWKVDFVSAAYPGCAPVESMHGYRVIRIPDNYLFNFKFRRYWEKTLSANGYDLVIDDISKIPLATPRYIRQPILAIQHHIHGESLFTQLPFPLALYVYLMERFFLKFYRNTPLVAVSESTRKELMKLCSFSQITVSHNGIEFRKLNAAYAPPAKKKPVILYFGRLKRYKRVDHVIRAFEAVKMSLPAAELWIAGKGDHEPALKELVQRMELGDSVKFLGFITERQKSEVFSRATLGVIASEKEGWGISVIESNAAGVPVIGYDVEGLRDSIQDGRTGYLVKNGSIGALAGRITSVLANRKLLDRLSRNAVKWASRFDWDNMAAEFYRIARTVSGRSQGS